ncbi:hypothetical protein ACVWXP_007421 [Bradyrhizobium sp. USDA 4463]
MTDRSVYRAHNLASEVAEQNDRVRARVAQASEALKVPKPDTFLGRKTQELFPEEDPSSGRTSRT